MILDCTLRDGGYYVDWDFDDDTVRKYLAAVSTAKIDIIEIGFRFLPQGGFWGAYAYCTDEFLTTLPLPPGANLAVMVNAKELLNHGEGYKAGLQVLFRQKDLSPVDIVRVAVHEKDVMRCEAIAHSLHDLGYRVFVNLMQVGLMARSTLVEIVELVSSWKCVEVLYLADSFGNMDPESVITTISAVKEGWPGGIGIHAHDNKGQALMNTIAALDHGVEYLDATLLGMGRGAGNTKTENLLVEMVQRGYGEYFPDALLPLVLQDFRKMQEKFGWGTNICYFLSAVHGIHPTYIQKMLGDERYNTEQIIAAINFLKSTSAPFYSFDNMLRAISGMTGDENGSWSARNWTRGRDVLIIGAGPSTKRYIKALQQYVASRKPVVLCLNINESVPEEMVTAYVACHETRLLIESDRYRGLGKALILPLSRVPESIKETLKGVEVLDYGLRIEENDFKILENGCVLRSPLALIYAISVATASGANRILLSGVDGYDVSDPRQKEMVEILESYTSLDYALPVKALTPTSYPIPKGSIFEPEP